MSDQPTKMNPELKARWVAALRSGEYEQGASRFEDGEKFCCLGVLCKVAGEKTETDCGFNNWDAVSPIIGDSSKMDALWHMNDGVYEFRHQRRSFSEIASWIEEHL